MWLKLVRGGVSGLASLLKDTPPLVALASHDVKWSGKCQMLYR